ncbi:hypothetical protein CFE70_005857 [Pyrenophora teres f. teres 0-1]
MVVNSTRSRKRSAIYTTREAASEQMGNVQMFFDLKSAEIHMRKHGHSDPRIRKSAFQAAETFTPSPSIPLKQEFEVYASSQSLVGKKARNSTLVTAMYDEIVYHYLPEGLQLDQYDEQKDAIKCLYQHQKLQIYRELCRISGKTLHRTIQECTHELKAEAPYVNLWDFIDACRTGERLKPFYDWGAFVSYTRSDRLIPLQYALQNEFLAVFLQNLRQGPRSGNRKQVGAPVGAPVKDQGGPYGGDYNVILVKDQYRPQDNGPYRPDDRDQHRDQSRPETISTSTPPPFSSKYDTASIMSPISERSRSSSPSHQNVKSSRSSTPTPAASTQPSSASDIDSSAAFIKKEPASSRPAPVLSLEADCAMLFDTVEDDDDIAYELSQVPYLEVTQRDLLDDGNAIIQLFHQHKQRQVKVKGEVSDGSDDEFGSDDEEVWTQVELSLSQHQPQMEEESEGTISDNDNMPISSRRWLPSSQDHSRRELQSPCKRRRSESPPMQRPTKRAR